MLLENTKDILDAKSKLQMVNPSGGGLEMCAKWKTQELDPLKLVVTLLIDAPEYFDLLNVTYVGIKPILVGGRLYRILIKEDI